MDSAGIEFAHALDGAVKALREDGPRCSAIEDARTALELTVERDEDFASLLR